jgi:polysaccharide export outer membrane protein
MIARRLTLPSPARLLLVVGLLLGLGCAGPGCAGGKHRERKIAQPGVVDPSLPRELQMVSMPRHVVEPPDELEITVDPSLPNLTSARLVVQPDGSIDLGLYGRYIVSGQTLDQIEQQLALNLGMQAQAREPKKPLDPIQVSARLTDGRESKRYYVIGTVSSPNSFPITGNETVLDGILKAGLKSNSVPEKAYLVRPQPGGGPDQVFKIDWSGITQRGDTCTNYQLMPGDRIYVPGTKPPGLIKALVSG